VLDLYAGTGALGIEALSRGAESATFVDDSPRAIRAIVDNLHRTDLSGTGRTAQRGVLDYLRESVETVDIVFADPPYDADPSDLNALVTGVASHLAGDRWRVVLTRPTKGYRPVIPVDWRAARELRYGDTLVLVYQQEP
jgi:16S rRNA (guanine966-N2)-methyltransferase